MKKYLKKIVFLYVFIALLNTVFIYSQTTETSIRTSFNLEKKITKKLSLEVSPEIRVDQNFELSSYLIKTSIDYKFTKWLSAGAQYRFKANKLDETENDASFEYANRFAVDATTKFKLDRFTPKFRLQFSNFSDFDEQTEDKSNFLRYRFGTDYNIKGSKITPYASVEFFQRLSTGLISKTRYTIGGEYKIDKSNAVDLSYSYDDKHKSYNTFHIVGLSYKYKF